MVAKFRGWRQNMVAEGANTLGSYGPKKYIIPTSSIQKKSWTLLTVHTIASRIIIDPINPHVYHLNTKFGHLDWDWVHTCGEL